MGYVRDHWQGRHPLWRAFWINFLIPFILAAIAEPWIRPGAAGASVAEAVLASLYILFTHAVVLPWQIVGLWRSARRHLNERGDLGVVTFAQGAALVAIVTAVGATTTTVQRITGFGQDTAKDSAVAPRYALTVLTEDRAIAMDGPFDTGISRDFKALLAETPEIETVILNSDGGRVFEARGVARQILDNGLDTHVDTHCRSACAIVYVAGRTRTLGDGGRLGFHSYALGAVVPFVDPKAEEQKDVAFFLSQGIDPDFVTHVFATPHESMWQPRPERLLGAGVVHRVVGARRP